ncbi:MAG: hypothetical protein FWD16_07575, partial [Clostridia bacterium]|nr:hypothetical protein [Clostridia bacterium]
MNTDYTKIIPRPATPDRNARVLGPGAGGAHMSPAWNPGDFDNWLCGTDMSQNFISNDGGKSFRM